MISKELYKIPIEDTGCVGNIRITTNGVVTFYEYEYWSIESQKDYIGGVKFDWTIAIRFRNELHSSGFCDDSYTTLAEILESDWIQHLYNIESSGIYKSAKNMHHYALFYPDSGYFEVIADSYILLEPREGKLPELR